MERKTIWDGYVRIGEDVITTDRDGLTHIAHYDSHNCLVGRSYETRDNRGDIYMVHEDARGNRLGYSTLERDWWGDYYVKTEETAWGRRQQQEAETEQSQVQQPEDDDYSGGGGCCLGGILYGLIMLVLKFFLYMYVGVAVVSLGGTIWMFPLMQWLNNSGNASLEWFWILAALCLSYSPYLGIILFRRIKKQTKWKQFFLSVLLWAIIGPFAYLFLFRKKKASTQPLPPETPAQSQTFAYCPGCGHPCKPGQRFCGNCGMSLRADP